MYKGVSHPAILVPRPQLSDGRYLLRTSTGMSPTNLVIGPELSADICAVCGYGLTPRQIEMAKEVDPSVPHTALSLVELEARRLNRRLKVRLLVKSA